MGNMPEWLYYNFPAGSFHTKKLCIADCIRLKLNFIKKIKIAFEPPFVDGNVYTLQCTPSIARLKARGRLFVTIELFCYRL